MSPSSIFRFGNARLSTDPMVRAPNPPLRPKKRIIVCCDGTSLDGVVAKERWKYSNVLKISRALNLNDERTGYAIPQIVFYQAGIGTEPNLYSKYVQGELAPAIGGSFVQKVEEAYAFITQNFNPGDEISLFGFSRGAYTVRIVAMLIGAIGFLDRIDMGQFSEILGAYQKLGKSNDPSETSMLQAKLSCWTSPNSRGKLRATSNGQAFSIKCVGVFDTVSSLGLPEEVTRKSPSTISMFGLPNSELGDHIERAYQALAIYETRLDYNCIKFKQTNAGRRKGQILKQCWFGGEHLDIGGGFHDHDISDLTLFWMVANIEGMLSMDLRYIRWLVQPVFPWGKQPPHDPRTGIYALSMENTRQLPTKTDDVTHETIHPSVLEQDRMSPQLRQCIQNNPSLLCGLLPFEEEMRRTWPYVPGKNPPTDSRAPPRVESAIGAESATLWSATREVVSVGRQLGTGVINEVRTRVAVSKTTGGPAGKQPSVTSRLVKLPP